MHFVGNLFPRGAGVLWGGGGGGMNENMNNMELFSLT
jgi:hypothetical protein